MLRRRNQTAPCGNARPSRRFPRGVKRPGLASGLFRFEFLKFFLLGIEQIEDFIVKVFGKAQRTLAIFRHATLQREITKVCETKKLSFLLTETKNLPDQVRVIVLRRRDR